MPGTVSSQYLSTHRSRQMSGPRRFLRVANWNRIQNPKRRNKMPWTCLHRDWLEDYEFTNLSLTNRGVLFCLHMLAARSNNRIPLDHRWIGHKIAARPQVVGKAVVTLMRIGLIEEFVEDKDTGKNNDLVQILGARTTPAEGEIEIDLETEGPLTQEEQISTDENSKTAPTFSNGQPKFEVMTRACMDAGLRGSNHHGIARVAQRVSSTWSPPKNS